MALEQNKQCFLHRWLCPRTPGVFSLAIQGVTFYPRSQQKRATPTWCYSPHSTTLRFGALSSVAHTLMRYLDLTCELVSVQALPKHLHHLLPAFRVARFTRSAPHRHLLFQVTIHEISGFFSGCLFRLLCAYRSQSRFLIPFSNPVSGSCRFSASACGKPTQVYTHNPGGWRCCFILTFAT